MAIKIKHLTLKKLYKVCILQISGLKSHEMAWNPCLFRKYIEFTQSCKTLLWRIVILHCCFLFQSKYKQAGKKELVNCLYSLLPETKETQHAKEQTQLYSEVRNDPQPLSVNTFIFIIKVWRSVYSVTITRINVGIISSAHDGYVESFYVGTKLY